MSNKLRGNEELTSIGKTRYLLCVACNKRTEIEIEVKVKVEGTKVLKEWNKC